MINNILYVIQDNLRIGLFKFTMASGRRQLQTLDTAGRNRQSNESKNNFPSASLSLYRSTLLSKSQYQHPTSPGYLHRRRHQSLNRSDTKINKRSSQKYISHEKGRGDVGQSKSKLARDTKRLDERIISSQGVTHK
jgi:hypothetical protein